jgi:hypothetical protein
MTPRFVIWPAAEADVLDAAPWYESPSPGVGRPHGRMPPAER